MLLSLMIARVQQALLPIAGVPLHGINDRLCIVERKSRQAPELSDETQHPSSTDRGDASRKKWLVYIEISIFGSSRAVSRRRASCFMLLLLMIARVQQALANSRGNSTRD